jgi:hypothetical protein
MITTMRRIAMATLAVLAVAGCGSTTTKTVTVVRTVPQKLGGDADQQLFGHVKSIAPTHGAYLLRFDPAWLVTGVTANVAAAEDDGTTCKPSSCPPVPNDVYAVDESHRLLTFLLPAGTRGAVLVGGGLNTKTVGAAELARIVAGTSSLKLFEPLDSGVWIRVHSDTVQTFAQQYRP